MCATCPIWWQKCAIYPYRCGYHGDERDSCGVTPLMDAARANHIEAVQFLISEYEVCIAVR